MAKEMSFVAAMKDFFGKKDGQDDMNFTREVMDAMKGGNRDYWVKGLETVGYKITNAS